jgi:hypothetical protein
MPARLEIYSSVSVSKIHCRPSCTFCHITKAIECIDGKRYCTCSHRCTCTGRGRWGLSCLPCCASAVTSAASTGRVGPEAGEVNVLHRHALPGGRGTPHPSAGLRRPSAYFMHWQDHCSRWSASLNRSPRQIVDGVLFGTATAGGSDSSARWHERGSARSGGQAVQVTGDRLAAK